MALLPDGRLLITEKPGRLRIFANGKLSAPVENVPAVAYRPKQGEQGGLLDVAVDPEFAQNGRIYLSYSEEAPQPSAQPTPPIGDSVVSSISRTPASWAGPSCARNSTATGSPTRR